MQSADSVPPAARQGCAAAGSGCLTLFGLVFAVAGVAIGTFYVNGVRDWWRTQSWVETPAWIETANLRELRSRDSKGHTTITWEAEATYRYEFNGRSYHSSQVTPSGGADNFGSFQKDAYAELNAHAGRSDPFRCYVDPDKPENAVLYRQLRWPLLALMAIFPLIFPAAGGGIMVLGLVGARQLSRVSQLKRSHPDAPWKWKAAWGGETIPAERGIAMWTYAAGVGWGCIVLAPLFWAMIKGGAFTDWTAWFVLAGPAFLLIFALKAWKQFKHRLRFGGVRLALREWPAMPGRAVVGDILFGKALSGFGEVKLTLRCDKKVTTGSGKSRRTTTEHLWEHHENQSLAMVYRDGSGSRLPIRIQVPEGLPSSTIDGSSVEHVWMLAVHLPGAGFVDEMDIPVFGSPNEAGHASPAGGHVPAHSKVVYELPPEELPERLRSSGVEAEFDGRGVVSRVKCPPGRYRGMIAGLVLFDLIWTAAAVAMLFQGAPFLFVLIFGGSAIAIWLWVLRLAMQQRTATFDRLGMEIITTLGPRRKVEKFERRHVLGFISETNTSSGSTRFYTVRAQTTFGTKPVLVDGVQESVVADALIKRFEAWRVNRE